MILTKKELMIGKTVSITLFVLGLIYIGVTAAGLLTLQSQSEPIHDPWFALMELLILVMAPIMVVLMVVIHAYAVPEKKIFSLAALVFMSIMAGITCCVHYLVFFVGRNLDNIAGLESFSYLFSFRWPSAIYAMDILAWDLFFPLSIIFAAFVFKESRLDHSVRLLMLVSGAVSLIGLLGPVFGNMLIRDIGIIGYAVIFPVVCLFLSFLFNRMETNVTD